ncbi:MAG: lamin tail domain-containing protein [Chitinophagaceae bacterium]
MQKFYKLLVLLLCAGTFSVTAQSQVIISQVYGGGGNSGATYKNDFVELFNPTDAPVNLSGWSLQYASSTGTSWTNRTNLSGTIAPGGFFLVQLAAGNGGTEDLPTPDQIGTINMSGTTGKIALLNTTNVIASGTTCPIGNPDLVDFVGFGVANCFEGSSAAATLTNATAAIRTDLCTDANDNGTDFTRGAPTPRNSATPVQLCNPVGSDTEKPFVTGRNTDGLEQVPVTIKPTLTFNENIQPLSGTVTVQTSLGQVFELPLSGNAVVVSNNTLTLNISLKPLRTYTISLPAGIVEDAAGNDFDGVADWTFSTGEQQLAFDFNTCSSSSLGGFTQYSVSGSQTWSCTSFGENGSGGVQINGFSGGARENEDWLISPSFDLSGMPYPVLSFASVSSFEGPSLKLMVSTNYDGTGNPADFDWTEIGGHFPEVNSAVWTTSAQLDLGAFRTENVYFAFVYTSSPELQASRWTIDNFVITKDVAPQPVLVTKPSILDFDYVKLGSASGSSILTVDAYNLSGDITFTGPAGFELSLDNQTFTPAVTVDEQTAEAGVLNLYIRFSPAAANMDYSGKLTASFGGNQNDVAALSGTSLRALKVANWNVEWFGGPNGPGNDDEQQRNVKTILQRLNADIYALSEVVNVERLEEMVASMPGYAYTVNDYGSYADNTTDPDYVTAQKLAFIYKQDVVKNISTYGVLRNGGSNSAYNNWASGRFPYLMKAEVNLEGVQTTVNFVLVHGKANTGNVSEQIESWHRRKGGADELKDSLDAQYQFSNVVILGDFNDDLDKTIASGIPGDVTSYISYITDNKGYKPVTLPLSLESKKSTVAYNDIIDHQVASNEMGVAYVPGSAQIADYVSTWVSSYGNSTSDHYPVVARYDLRFFTQPIDFKGFTGSISGSNIRFDWYTNHEINSNYFVVERSRNGIDFTAVDSVQSFGDSRTRTDYTLTHKPWPGQSHYRLRVSSLDGTVYYSNVQTINMKWGSSALSVNANNPSAVQVAYTAAEEKQGVLQLLDLNGNILYSKASTFAKGQNIRQIDTQKLAAGIYIVRIVYPDAVQSEKVYINK